MKYFIFLLTFALHVGLNAQCNHPDAITVVHSIDTLIAQYKDQLFPIEIDSDGYYVIRPMPTVLGTYVVYVKLEDYSDNTNSKK